MKRMKWPAWIGTIVLVAILFVGFGTVLAEQGGADDPLVSLSYLNDQLTPSFLRQVDEKLAARESQISENLQEQIDDAIANFEGGGTTVGSTYQVVTLDSGKTLRGKVGTEILLRRGTGICVSSTLPGLINMTEGGTLTNGNALKANNLYLITDDGRGVYAQNSTLTLLVKGYYTIES